MPLVTSCITSSCRPRARPVPRHDRRRKPAREQGVGERTWERNPE
ncbi:hypothetical protein [Novacetimonas pomaceti]|nr:hypothetical protein [Novacetimonas pomaceti]